jgi:hypothetical protein
MEQAMTSASAIAVIFIVVSLLRRRREASRENLIATQRRFYDTLLSNEDKIEGIFLRLPFFLEKNYQVRTPWLD